MVAAQVLPLWLVLLCAGVSGCEARAGEAAPDPKPRSERPLAQPRPASTPSQLPAPPPRDAAAERRARFPSEFQLTSMRGTSHTPYLEGNTRDALRAAAREGIRYVEVDLVLTRDDSLVTAHQAYVKGCGTLSKMRENQVLGCQLGGGLRVATLDAVLALPFKGIFLDLKDTREPDPERARRAVERAAQAVVASQRRGDVVLMLYDTPPESVKPVREHHLRAGIKGYPKSVEETARMVARAAELEFEMVSVNTDYVTPELVGASTKQGVWHLPWSTDPTRAGHWRSLAASGVGGLIVLNYDLAKQQVAPHWVDARRLDVASPR